MSSYGTNIDDLVLRRPVDVSTEIGTIGLLAPGITPTFRGQGSEVAQALDVMREAAGAFGSFARFTAIEREREAERQRFQDQAFANMEEQRAKFDKEIVASQKDYAAKTLNEQYLVDTQPENMAEITKLGGDGKAIAYKLWKARTEGADPAYRDYVLSHLTDYESAINKHLDGVRRATIENQVAVKTGRMVSTPPNEVASTIQEILTDKSLGDMSEADRLSRIVVPAMKSAAAVGDTKRLEAIKGQLGNLFLSDQIQADSTYRATRERIDRDAEDGFEAGIYASIDRQESPEMILRKIDLSPISPEKKVSLKNSVLNKSHNDNAELMASQLDDGLFTDYDLFNAELVRRGNLPPDNPAFMNAAWRERLRNRFPKAIEKNAIAEEVAANQKGGGNTLLNAHSDELFKYLRSTGAINAGNQIADTGKMVQSLTSAEIVPGKIREIVERSFSNPGSQSMAATAETLAKLRGTTAYNNLVSDYKDDERWKLDWAIDRYEAGWFQSADGLSRAAADFKETEKAQALKKPEAASRIDRVIREINKNDKQGAVPTINTISTDIMSEIFPGVEPWIDSIDVVNREYATAYNHARQQGMDEDSAARSARSFAISTSKSKLIQTSWNGRKRITASYDTDVGPSASVFTWSPWDDVDEADAKKALSAGGYDAFASRIIGVKPIRNNSVKPDDPRSREVGFAFELDNGDILTTDNGNAVLFFPTVRAPFQKELEKANMGRKASPTWSTSIGGAVQ